jgi:hypothetical protein
MFEESFNNPIEFFKFFGTWIPIVILWFQFNRQKKNDRTALILKLFNDFFTNDKLIKVFNFLDVDYSLDRDGKIRAILIGDEKNEIQPSEQDFVVYLNYFNSLAILCEEKVFSRDMVLNMFRYQLQKTFSYASIMEYVELYGFEKIKFILPNEFFFYGTLKDEKSRKNIVEISEKVKSALIDSRTAKVLNFKYGKNKLDEKYMALYRAEASSFVFGNLIQISKDATWHLLFKQLDEYEEVPILYDRVIIKTGKSLFSKSTFAWAYIGKN